jgi:2-oxoglutarate ferredoxin oxidoreductase subunit gamma
MKTYLKRFEIRFSGLGGQGVITLGRLLGHGLALGCGYNVTQTQSYGPEARGGASRSDLVISSEPISYPKAESLDLLAALSQEACNKFYRWLKPKGVLLIETDMVRQPPSNVFIGLPFTALAKEKVGAAQAMNAIVLGAITHILPFAQPRAVKKALEENLPAKSQAINLKAFNLGQRQARTHFGPAPEIWSGAGEKEEEPEKREVL